MRRLRNASILPSPFSPRMRRHSPIGPRSLSSATRRTSGWSTRAGQDRLRYRSGDPEGSKQAVLGIAPEEIKGNAHQLMALARVRAWLNLDGVPELAYRARRSGFDDPDIHQAYMSLVLHRKRDEDSVLQIAKAQSNPAELWRSEEPNLHPVFGGALGSYRLGECRDRQTLIPLLGTQARERRPD